MDSRFVRVWHELSATRGEEPFDRTLAKTDSTRLVQALAGAGAEDPVAANAIATELLNRLSRARYFGAFVTASLIAVAMLIADAMLNGAFGLIEGDPMSVDLSLVAFVVGVVAMVALIGARRALHRVAGRARGR